MNPLNGLPIRELSGSALLAAGDPLSHVLDHNIEALARFGITKHVLMMLLASALLLILFPAAAKRIASGNPGRFGTLFESLLLFVRDEMARPFLGKDTERFLPMLWSFFFFILFCNLIGLVPFMGTATGNISVTAALALVAFFFYHYQGVKENGLVHYLKANLLVGPPFLWPLMIPLEFLGIFIKPIALTLRLFANMMGGHIMLAVVIGFTGIFTMDNLFMGGAIAGIAAGGAIFLYFLELLVAFIQAFIFTFLTTVFLSLALHPEH